MSGLPQGRIVAGVAVVTAIIVAVAIARGGGDAPGDEATAPPSEVPEGYALFDGEAAGSRFSFIYPEDWGEVSEREGETAAEVIFEIDGGESGGTVPLIRLGVQADSASPEAILQANVAAAQLSANDLEVTSEEDVTVPGAEAARRAETDYSVPGAGGEPEAFRSILLAAAGPDESIFSLIVSDRETDPRFDMEAVAASLRIDPPSEGSDA